MPRRAELVESCRVRAGRRFRLADVDPADTRGEPDEERAEARLQALAARIGQLQERLYASRRWAALFVFQGMDASGKDGAVEHVFARAKLAGCRVTSFKPPSPEELEHDFLWRCSRALPERGEIGIFNRSHYEEVATVRVHPEFLAKQNLPARVVTKALWDERCDDIVAFERYLARNGVLIRKFFLHVSRAEQRRRFVARMEQPEKNWKFKLRDVQERAHWREFQRAWSHALSATSTDVAPWFVIPADQKWYARLVVAEAVVAALEGLRLEFPRPDAQRRADLRAARTLLDAEKA